MTFKRISIGDICRTRVDKKPPKDDEDYHIFTFSVMVECQDGRIADTTISITKDELNQSSAPKLLENIVLRLSCDLVDGLMKSTKGG